MLRVVTAVAGNQVASADYNELQDRSTGELAANKNNDYGTTGGKGFDSRLWQPTGGSLATATLVQIDSSVDWRDRIVWGFYVTAGSAGNLPGGASDYDFRRGVAAPNFFHGYTGTGAYSNVAGAGTAVSNGNPPVAGAGGVRSYRVEVVTGANVYLYVDPADGSLYMYNDSGVTIYPCLINLGTGDTGKR